MATSGTKHTFKNIDMGNLFPEASGPGSLVSLDISRVAGTTNENWFLDETLGETKRFIKTFKEGWNRRPNGTLDVFDVELYYWVGWKQ